MDTFRSIILNGHINNLDDSESPNAASNLLELIPSYNIKTKEPVNFEIDFFYQKHRIKYSLKVDLGSFLDADYDREIVFEELSVIDYKIFTRDSTRGDTVEIFDLKGIENYLSKPAQKDVDNLALIAQSSLQTHELFLTSGFKVMYSPKFTQLILDWFSSAFMVIYRADSNLFRRDEIKFVERDELTQESELYSLSDFRTSGKQGVRKGEDYLGNYFISRYGAIKDIDFSPVFEMLLESEEEMRSEH